LGEQLGVPVHLEMGAQDPVAVCQAGLQQAKATGADVLILDTAGRLHIDDELMQQLKRIDQRVSPHQVYLVVDGMTGQDAVNSAKAFNEALELDGVILTKLDGDTRGGAVLSVKEVTGVPIKFIGTGEHLDALQEFHPDRMAQRVLGMGDILTLVEQAQSKFDQDEMARQEERMRKGEFTLEDFRRMMLQTKKLGPLNKLMGMIPGMGNIAGAMQDVDADNEMRRLQGIIDSMTPDERRNPSKNIDQSRRRRIAVGAGVEPHVVNDLVKQFDGMSEMMKRMAGMGAVERMREMQKLQAGFTDPNARLTRAKVGTGKRLSSVERAKLKKQRDKEMRKRKREGRRS
jgi:signal recognition particle subunit SRP54